MANFFASSACRRVRRASFPSQPWFAKLYPSNPPPWRLFFQFAAKTRQFILFIVTTLGIALTLLGFLLCRRLSLRLVSREPKSPAGVLRTPPRPRPAAKPRHDPIAPVSANTFLSIVDALSRIVRVVASARAIPSVVILVDGAPSSAIPTTRRALSTTRRVTARRADMSESPPSSLPALSPTSKPSSVCRPLAQSRDSPLELNPRVKPCDRRFDSLGHLH